ncbi:sulfite exporter TauE/SafE family protein [Fluviispira vulneris]|uniref:sulfite exporter TauE/SafE family protein n=1 Tax=Fluviispira vulneris TaxID=2763012 RepID=UPI0016490651|nr:sulfite exporter TauE/SafE family protein [Fluviispira vulneris]
MSEFLDIIVPLSSVAIFGFSGSLHCLGMCSPMVATCHKKTWQYFMFRLFSYTTIGVLSGFFGLFFFEKFLGLSARKIAWIVAIVSLLQICYLLKKSSFDQSIISQKILNKLMKYSPLSYSATLGIVTALLPCGFLYAAILMCISYANPVISGLGMLTFSIVTSPVLIGGKGVFIFLTRKNVHIAKYVSILLLLIVAIFALMRGGVFKDFFNHSHEQPTEHKVNCH